MIRSTIDDFIRARNLNKAAVSPRVRRDMNSKTLTLSSVSTDWLIEQWSKLIERLSPNKLQNLIRNVAVLLQDRLNLEESFDSKIHLSLF